MGGESYHSPRNSTIKITAEKQSCKQKREPGKLKKKLDAAVKGYTPNDPKFIQMRR